MSTTDLIPANDFCASHHLEISFIHSLRQYGLIEVTTVSETLFIPASQLPTLEKLVRLYYELDINLEGIDAITNLLLHVENMQHEITRLRNRLRFYEDSE